MHVVNLQIRCWKQHSQKKATFHMNASHKQTQLSHLEKGTTTLNLLSYVGFSGSYCAMQHNTQLLLQGLSFSLTRLPWQTLTCIYYNHLSCCILMALNKKKMVKCFCNKTVLQCTSVTRHEMPCMSNGIWQCCGSHKVHISYHWVYKKSNLCRKNLTFMPSVKET